MKKFFCLNFILISFVSDAMHDHQKDIYDQLKDNIKRVFDKVGYENHEDFDSYEVFGILMRSFVHMNFLEYKKRVYDNIALYPFTLDIDGIRLTDFEREFLNDKINPFLADCSRIIVKSKEEILAKNNNDSIEDNSSSYTESDEHDRENCIRCQLKNNTFLLKEFRVLIIKKINLLVDDFLESFKDIMNTYEKSVRKAFLYDMLGAKRENK